MQKLKFNLHRIFGFLADFKAGFTMVELLVTISIILLLTGAGIAGFINFNDRQIVQSTVKDVKQLMRAGQVKARSGEGAGTCTSPGKLRGYSVVINGTVMELRKVCIDPNTSVVTDNDVRSTIELNNVVVTNNPAANVTFLALGGGVDTDGNAAITYNVAGQFTSIEYEFQVLETGEITEGDFVNN